MTIRWRLAQWAVMAALAAPVAAQQAISPSPVVTPSRPGAQRLEASGGSGVPEQSLTTLRGHVTTIRGHVCTTDGVVVVRARIQLRDVDTGRVVRRGASDMEGAFQFARVPRGVYLVEYVDATGRVLGVGHVMSMGEVVTVAIRTSVVVPGLVGSLTGNIAAIAVHVASTAGVTLVLTTTSPTTTPVPPASSIR